MLKLLQSIFGSAHHENAKFDETLIEKATERVVDGTDPRLRALSGYRKSLRPAVECSVDFVLQFVNRFPPATEFSHSRCSDDPTVKAFFPRLNACMRRSEKVGL